MFASVGHPTGMNCIKATRSWAFSPQRTPRHLSVSTTSIHPASGSLSSFPIGFRVRRSSRFVHASKQLPYSPVRGC